MSDPYNTIPGQSQQPPPQQAPRVVSGPAAQLTDAMVTTAFELPRYRIVENLGVVRGIMVRSRSVVGNLLGGFQTLFGGNITIYTNLCEQARAETYREMFAHARQRRANAIIGMRYDATEVMPGLMSARC